MTASMYNEKKELLIQKISEFIDQNTFNKVLNKITDYAEVLTEGKLSGLVNFNFRLNSEQTGLIIELLTETNAVSIINNLALKGSKNLEIEYISNIFSDPVSPESISSYISIRNFLENRLTHQVQQYNMNMSKSNTTHSMPLNELRGHVKTFYDLANSNLPISTKVQHGMIAASLHDAYIIFINRTDWWNDKTYIKFFFNEDDPTKKDLFLLTRHKRLPLVDINHNIDEILEELAQIKARKLNLTQEKQELPESINSFKSGSKTKQFNDKMLLTPFGRQYGNTIDTVLKKIFSSAQPGHPGQDEEKTNENILLKISPLFNHFAETQNTEYLAEQQEPIIEIIDYLLTKNYPIKTFAEKLLYTNKKETFGHFYEKNKTLIDDFLYQIFVVYFNYQFRTLFKFIRTQDLKTFACAFIIKRIYLLYGENLTRFGYQLVTTIAKIGGIKNNT